jgi:hypothetical protein
VRKEPVPFFLAYTAPSRSVEKAFPGFFNYRLAKGASANLTNFLAFESL